MMLEYNVPIFIDAVLGDVDVNENSKTTLDGWTESMKSAWLQIKSN